MRFRGTGFSSGQMAGITSVTSEMPKCTDLENCLGKRAALNMFIKVKCWQMLYKAAAFWRNQTETATKANSKTGNSTGKALTNGMIPNSCIMDGL